MDKRLILPHANKWFAIIAKHPLARMRLFCFPHAGGGASAYRTWSRYLPDWLEVYALQLPGRENRFRETAFSNLPKLVEAILIEIAPYLNMPFAFFGHSMGALLSFELARAIRRVNIPLPSGLFVAGERAPQLPIIDSPIHALPQIEFLEKLKLMNGTPHAALEHEELMQVIMPTLRADLCLCETYQYVPEKPVACPIIVFGGDNDIQANESELAAWQFQTTCHFELIMLPGDHFFLKSDPLENLILNRLVTVLVSTLSNQRQ